MPPSNHVRHQHTDSGILLTESMLKLQATDQDIGFPDLTYGWAKLTGEYLARVAHQSRGLNVVVYRPMSGYGEDQNEAYPFKAILQRVMAQENPVMLWSNTTRDFVYIGDIVESVLDSMGTIKNGDPVNLATGRATSFEELARLMATYVGYEPTIGLHNDKPAGVAYRVGDATKMQELGCQVYTPLEKGIEIATRYMRNEEVPSMPEIIQDFEKTRMTVEGLDTTDTTRIPINPVAVTKQAVKDEEKDVYCKFSALADHKHSLGCACNRHK